MPNKFKTKKEYVMVFIPLLILLISYFYMDTQSIIRCGIDVFKSLFSGRLNDYYAFASESHHQGLMVHEPTYDFIFYLTVGIWELPLAIIETLTGKAIGTSFWAIVYSKMLLVVFFALCAHMVKRIAEILGVESEKVAMSQFMFMSTGFFLTYIGIAGQYDVIGLFFTLVGVYYYLQGDMKKFGIFFVISVQYKFFPLFIFLPLLLLREKRLNRILAYLAGPICTVYLFRIPFLNDGTAIAEKNKINAYMLDKILSSKIILCDVEIPLSFLTIGAVCIWCYLQDIAEEERGYYSIWVSFLSMGLLFISFPFYPYWLIYLTPWMPLLFFMKEMNPIRSLLVESGMTIGIMIAGFQKYYWVFDVYNAKGMLLDMIFPYDKMQKPIYIDRFFVFLKIDQYLGLWYGLFILCLVILIVMYSPKIIIQNQCKDANYRKLLYLRYIGQVLIAFFPVGIYLLGFVRSLL